MKYWKNIWGVNLLLAFDVANRGLGLLARGVALGWLADRRADCVAAGVVALPRTLRVAFLTEA